MDAIEPRFLRVCGIILQALDDARGGQLPYDEYMKIADDYVQREFPSSRGIGHIVHWVLMESHAMALSPFVYGEERPTYVTRNGGGHDLTAAMKKYSSHLRNLVERS